MSDQRKKNVNWMLPVSDEGRITAWEHVDRALLMDLRDELQEANRQLRVISKILGCPRFLNLPNDVAKLVKNQAHRLRQSSVTHKKKASTS